MEIHHATYLGAASPKTTLQYSASSVDLLDMFPFCSKMSWMAMGLSLCTSLFRRALGRHRHPHVEELIALTGDYRVARVAFDEAVTLKPPGKRYTVEGGGNSFVRSYRDIIAMEARTEALYLRAGISAPRTRVQ